MKTKKSTVNSKHWREMLAQKTSNLHSKLNLNLKTILYIVFSSVAFNTQAQISIRDTFERYTGQYEDGLLNLRQLDSVVALFLGTLPVDSEVGHYEKEFKRNMYFWKDRVYINAAGEENTEIYTTSLIEYLSDPICANGDEAKWEFNFDPSPIIEKPSFCAPAGAHGSGIVRSVYMNPANTNIILAGSGASGIWYTENGGENWECVTDNLRVPALGISEILDISNPSEPVGKYLIAITGKEKFNDTFGAGILKSDDFGKTWVRYGAFEVAGTIEYIVDITKPKGETNKLYAISQYHVFISSDRGITWTLANQPVELTDLEYLHSISASSLTTDIIYLSSKLRWDGGEAHFWKSELSEPDLLWQDETEILLAPVKDLHYLNLDTTELFSGDFNLMTPHFGFSRSLPSGDTTGTYDLEFEMYEGSMHLKSFPIIYSEWFYEEPIAHMATQQYLSLDLGPKITVNGDYLISFDAKIPVGARVRFSIDELFLTEVVGTDGLYQTYALPVTKTGPPVYKSLFLVQFIYNGDYDLDAADTLYMDNLHINIIRNQPLRPKVIDLANPNLEEEYVLLNVIDGALNIGNLYMLHTSNKAENFDLIYYEVSENLGLTRNFTAGYGIENGLYYGGAQFVHYDFEENEFLKLCTKHADVRDIQIVKNVGGLNRIIVGDDGGVSYSEDGGLTWVSLNGDYLPITEFYGIGLNPNDHKSIIGGTQDNGTFLGQHPAWSHIYGGDGGNSGFSPSPEHPNLFYFQSNNSIIVDSILGGLTVYNFPATSNKMAWFLGEPIEIDPVEGLTLYSGHKPKIYSDSLDQLYFGGVLVKHNLLEDSFTAYDFGGNTQGIGAIEIAKANTEWIYAATEENRSATSYEKLFLSVDGGASFMDQTLSSAIPIIPEAGNPSIDKVLNQVLDFKNINCIKTNPENEQQLWIGLSGLHKRDGEVFEGELRVLKSSNGGITWYDYSKGLPPFPINDLIYQEGTNDRLFAATDAGVFYRDASMSEWVCFQEGMPITFVTDLEIDYCKQELFAATFGRGIWKTPINLPDSEPVVISENLTWGGTQTFDHDIIIESGNTLTLTGTLKMAGSKRIIVEKGARLKVDGGTLTSACDAFWGGVIVQGNFSLEQTPANQGVVTLLNEALIENANVGVALWQPGDWTSTGGIIHSSNATFKNNKKDVEFIQYTNHNGYGVLPNVSYFTETTFTWTDDFMADNPLGHVTMYWVDGVRFTACDFNDERTSPPSRYQTDYGRNNSGIYSLDAHYYVLAGCADVSGCTGKLSADTDWKPCTFTNLDFGIYAANNVTENAITVDRAVFTNNLYGVQTVNVNGPSINRNQFNYTNVDNNFETYTSYGVHLIRSGGIKVEENELSNESSTGLIVGITATDLGESEELLYKNEFNNMDYGIVARGKNRLYDPSGTETQKGLQFQCNQNEDNTRDFLTLGILWDGPGSPYHGVKALNGTSTNPSGNSFSDVSGALVGEHYSNQSTNAISYFYYDGASNQEPVDYLGDLFPFDLAIENTCLTQLTEAPYISYSGSGIAPFKTDFNTASAALATKKAAYSSLLNGGNTSALLAAIASMTTSNASSMRTNLLNASPYLTDAVVRAALDKSNAIFPNSWGYELVMENIEVAYNTDFIDFLSTKTNPMPSWMIEDIEDAVAIGTSTDLLVKQSELAELEKVKSYAANQILHAFKNDTTGIEIDSLRNWVTQKNDLMVQTRVIDTYLHQGDYSTASTKLSVLESAISSYPTHVQAELTAYVSYKEKMVDLLSAGVPLDSLSAADYSFVEDHAYESEGIASYQAQELLCFFYGNCAEYALVIPQTSQSMAQIIPSEKTEIKRAFQVYPNPATDWVTIVMPEVDGQMQLAITDLTGRVILVETITKNLFNWDTKTMSNGTYLITLINLTTGERIGAEKVVLQH